MFAAGIARSHSARVGPVYIYTFKSVYVRMLCCTYVISAYVCVCVCVCIIYICMCVCVFVYCKLCSLM
jgi:hypothetical protein